MRIELEMPEGLEEQLRNIVLDTVKDAFNTFVGQTTAKEWMSIKEGADYAGVSFNTFKKYRMLGLKVCEIDSVKRVSKAEIDNFLTRNSY
ncbi:MAG: DNA-binding protein [Solibacillus sp.]|uniref:DNA-binding protein n=1 Tax=unclassified Solibacillus TaxID=2637870 RepID=UPI0030F58F00